MQYSAKNQKGSILIYTLMVLLSIIVISITLLRILLPKYALVRESTYSTLAIYAADSGLEWCLYNVRNGNAVEVVQDNADTTGVTIVGAWTAYVNPGNYGPNYIHDRNPVTKNMSVTFTPYIPVAGTYNVYLRWINGAATGRSTVVPVDIVHSAGTNTYITNQTIPGNNTNLLNPVPWNLIATHDLTEGTGNSVRIRNTGANQAIVVDAVRFEKVTQTVLRPAMSNNSVYNIYFGGNPATCASTETPYNHRTVGTYRGISRSLELF